MIVTQSSYQANIDTDLIAIQLERDGELMQFNVEDHKKFINKLDKYYKENPDKEMFDLWLTNEPSNNQKNKIGRIFLMKNIIMKQKYLILEIVIDFIRGMWQSN